MNLPALRASSVVWLLLLLVAAAYTLLIVQCSFRTGRLAQEITYDDVVYFKDGLERLNLFHEEGAGKIIADYARHPAHAPASINQFDTPNGKQFFLFRNESPEGNEK